MALLSRWRRRPRCNARAGCSAGSRCVASAFGAAAAAAWFVAAPRATQSFVAAAAAPLRHGFTAFAGHSQSRGHVAGSVRRLRRAGLSATSAMIEAPAAEATTDSGAAVGAVALVAAASFAGGLKGKLDRAFQHALSTLLPNVKNVKAQVLVADPRFGDYQCNNAMSLFKRSKQDKDNFPAWKSPKDAGEAIVQALPADVGELMESVVVSPQGFITLTLKESWFEEAITDLYQNGLRVRAPKSERVVMDYSSPNIAKEMHVGHLRSTILGDSIANLLEFLGHEVVRLNHVGDWGTQFGMLLEYLRRQDQLEAAAAADGSQSLLVSDLQTFYKAAKQCFDEDATFKEASQANVVALQSGETWARDAWNRICEASRVEFETIYKRLSIEGLVERGESFYNDMLPSVIEEISESGLVQEDGGAACVFTNASKAPLIVRKADGGYGYDSTDVAAVRHRVFEESADRVIYVIDNGQETHMRMVFEVAEKAKWLEKGVRLDFMGFGLVQGQDGKKFKTRAGTSVRLRDLLDEAAVRAAIELRRRAAEKAGDDGSAAVEEASLLADAEQIGVAAVKYFDLRQNRNSDYRFSYDAMLDPKGNTGVYVLYAYARICAILRRAGRDASTLLPEAETEASELHPCERALALRVLRLPEVLEQVADDLLPSRLIDYVYGIATDFTSFYTECPVLNSERATSRLLLCELTRRTLETSLRIIGIKPLEKL